MRPDPALSAERILGLGLGFRRAMTVLSAVELGVFDLLATAGPLPLPEVCDRLGLAGRGAQDFLDALTAQGLLTRDEPGRYANGSDAAAFLVRGLPGYVGGLLELMNSGGYELWGKLSEALRTGRPQGLAQDGADFFEATSRDPAELAQVATAMSSYSRVSAPVLAERFPWADYRTFADIGCAEGLLATTLAARHPRLRGTGFDLPGLRPAFEAQVSAAGSADRISFQGGDFLAEELPGAEVLVFSHILHDWGLPTKKDLLAKAYRVLPAGGAVIVQECFIDDPRRTELHAMLTSLHMLLETTAGFDYTMADCERWLAEAGFGPLSRLSLTRTESVVVGIKEGAK